MAEQDTPKDYDPTFAARPRATTSADKGEQDKAAKARGGKRDSGAVKKAVEAGEQTPEAALAEVLASSGGGKQDGQLVRWLQKKIADASRAATPGTAKPPVPQEVEPSKLTEGGDYRTDASIAAPIGGGVAPSVGPGTAAGPDGFGSEF